MSSSSFWELAVGVSADLSEGLTNLVWELGALGVVEEEQPGQGARLRAFDRALPIASPPLSYGEHHAAALAIRIGAADFLAVNGIEPPLLVDEPVAYLDPDRAAHAWELLTRIAEQRQVIIATQDRLVLEHLGVEPTVVLGGALVGEPDR